MFEYPVLYHCDAFQGINLADARMVTYLNIDTTSCLNIDSRMRGDPRQGSASHFEVICQLDIGEDTSLYLEVMVTYLNIDI